LQYNIIPFNTITVILINSLLCIVEWSRLLFWNHVWFTKMHKIHIKCSIYKWGKTYEIFINFALLNDCQLVLNKARVHYSFGQRGFKLEFFFCFSWNLSFTPYSQINCFLLKYTVLFYMLGLSWYPYYRVSQSLQHTKYTNLWTLQNRMQTSMTKMCFAQKITTQQQQNKQHKILPWAGNRTRDLLRRSLMRYL